MAGKGTHEGAIRLNEHWKLVPCGGSNYELYRLGEVRDTSVTRRNGTSGKEAWVGVGRYYQHNTFWNAISYAAHEELKAGCVSEAMELGAAVGRLEELYGRMVSEVNAR